MTEDGVIGRAGEYVTSLVAVVIAPASVPVLTHLPATGVLLAKADQTKFEDATHMNAEVRSNACFICSCTGVVGVGLGKGDTLT